MQTEFEFTLPKGYVDGLGNLHKDGVMRLATAADEIAPMRDPRVLENPGYLSILILARVITKLGTLDQITPKVIEGLFLADMNHLQDTYARINGEQVGFALRPSDGMRIVPEIVRIKPREGMRFAVENGGEVAWRIEEREGGTIDDEGNYIAGSREGVYEVVARDREDETRSGSAFVIVAE